MIGFAYVGYEGRCVGRLLYFLYDLHPRLDYHVAIGDNDMLYWRDGEKEIPMASYTWEDDTDIPVLTFLGKFEAWQEQFDENKKELLKIDRIRLKASNKEPYSLKKEEKDKESKRASFLLSLREQLQVRTVPEDQ